MTLTLKLKQTKWKSIYPGVWMRPALRVSTCNRLVKYMEAHPEGWVGPNNADEIYNCPRTVASYPDYYSPEDVRNAWAFGKKFNEYPCERFPADIQVALLRLTEELMASVGEAHGVDLRRPLDPFVACYEKRRGFRSYLAPHVDKQRAAAVIQLNDPLDYKGGGTRYPNLDQLAAPAQQGDVVTHLGAAHYGINPIEAEKSHPFLVHEAVPVTAGKRYALCLFYM